MLGVTATNNQDKKSSYAHYGTWVGLSAPGGETGSVTARGVLSCTRTGYAYYQGTSMACPHVSGAAALLVSYAARLGYKLSSAEIKELLKSTADDHYDLNPAYVGKLGTGRLNAHNALLALIDYLVFVDNPENVVAATVSDSEIELNWQKNEDNDKVMVITNTVNEFGIPQKETEYQVGDSLLNGGVVLYIGDTENCLHSELSSFTTYYYKLFSFTEDFDYSRGVECEATTLCKMMEIQWEGFEDGNVLCLEQENIVGDLLWTIGQGNGGSFPDHAYEGNYNLYIASDSPDDIGSITRLFLPTLDMDGFNNAQLSFAFHNQANTDLTDHLTIYYKVADSTTWNIWKVYDENQDFWTLDTLTLPVNVATETLQICLEGKINGGHGICLDNLSIQGFINVGINTYNINNQITVYPNPTTGELRIENGELRINNVEIYDVYGRKLNISQFSILNSQLKTDISHLPSGIYFLRIETDKGIVTKKVINSSLPSHF